VVILLGVGVVALGGDDDPASTPTVLALSGSTEDALASCLPVTADVMATFPVDFAGTATAVSEGVATLEVTRWYRGGDADVVEISAPPAQPALVGGVDIVPGGDYLITAQEGSVSVCGFSGEATPELEAIFAEAFGG